MSAPGVLCAGRLYCDLVFAGLPRMPSLGTEVFSEGLSVHAGGGAFITAAHLARLGHKASLATMVPGPPFQALIDGQITEADLDTTLSETLQPGSDPQMTVALIYGGDRAFVSRRVGPPFPDLTAERLVASGAKHLHVGELASAIERPGLLAAARAAGMTVSLDCGWDDGLIAAEIRALEGAVDVFLPNEAEAAQLTQMDAPLALGRMTVIKQGANGATAMEGETTTWAGTRALTAVDTTGAGDAFNAGFLSAWLNGASTKTCLEAGNALGGQVVCQLGGFQSPKGLHQTQGREPRSA